MELGVARGRVTPQAALPPDNNGTAIPPAINPICPALFDFISFSEQMDTSTPAGKMVFTVLGAVARYWRTPGSRARRPVSTTWFSRLDDWVCGVGLRLGTRIEHSVGIRPCAW